MHGTLQIAFVTTFDFNFMSLWQLWAYTKHMECRNNWICCKGWEVYLDHR